MLSAINRIVTLARIAKALYCGRETARLAAPGKNIGGGVLRGSRQIQ